MSSGRDSRSLKVSELHKGDFKVPLEQTKVAIGPQSGRRGDKYVQARVDKACLEVVGPPGEEGSEDLAQIDLVARLADPYAVFVRG